MEAIDANCDDRSGIDVEGVVHFVLLWPIHVRDGDLRQETILLLIFLAQSLQAGG